MTHRQVTPPVPLTNDRMTRRLSDLVFADLGMPIKKGPIEGTITGVRHFIGDAGEKFTSVMVKVPVYKPRDPDHREIVGPSDTPLDGPR